MRRTASQKRSATATPPPPPGPCPYGAAPARASTASQKIYREQAKSNPAYLPDVAGALNNLGYLQLQLGQPEQAHASYEESIALFKPMAATNPAFQEDLQRVINNLEELNRKEGISSGKPVLALNDRSFLPKEDPNTPLRRSVLRLLPTFTGEKPGIRPGTAFVVKLQGDRAWIATARHVVFAKDDCRPAVTVEAELYAGALPEGLLPPRLEVVLPRLEWPAEGDDLIILELRGLPADVQPLPLSSAVPSGALKVIGHQTGQTAWSVMAFTPLKSNEQQIILDGSLLPGASGSPVLNGSGEVLGLVYETTTYAKQSMDLVSAYRTAVIQRLLP